VGGLMSYSEEECLREVLANHSPEECDKADDPLACRDAYASHGRGCGDGYEYHNGQCQQLSDDTSLSEDTTNPALTDAAMADIETLADAAKGKYMELLEADIEGETDPGRLAGLQAYHEFLEKSGETLESAQASFEQLQELKRIFVDSYDPSMDIEHMSVASLLGPGLWDRVSDRLFGPDEPPTGLAKENADADGALAVYAAMLKQQEENDFLKKDKLERLGDTVSSKFRDDVTGRVADGAKEIAEGVAGTAFIAVGVVGDAIESFQDEAQHQMFLGLARAYNRRRDALETQSPNLSPEEIHRLTVEQVQDDPYQDNTQLAVVKHGNILLNQDCQDDSNPLCVDNRVWWTAMDKTYRYNRR
jgi:hypothetical protein